VGVRIGSAKIAVTASGHIWRSDAEKVGGHRGSPAALGHDVALDPAVPP